MQNKKLKPKQLAFANLYLNSKENKMNAAKCYAEAGFKPCNLKAAQVYASKLLKRENVKAYIEKVQAKAIESVELQTGYTKAKIVKEFENLKEKCEAVEPVRDHKGVPTGEFKFDSNGAIRAMENIAKIMGAYSEAEKTQGNNYINILAQYFPAKELEVK